MQPSDQYPLKAAILREVAVVKEFELHLGDIPAKEKMDLNIQILKTTVSNKLGDCSGCGFTKIDQVTTRFATTMELEVSVTAACFYLGSKRCIHDADELRIPVPKALPKNKLFGSW